MNPRLRKFTIGRDQNCDIAIADDSVSRLHAELSLHPGGTLSLSDRGSSNGTVLIRRGVSKRVGHETLFPADRLRFGAVELPLEDLLTVLERKYPEVAGALAAAAGERAGSPGRAPAQSGHPGGQFVRCECGSIKTRGEKCKTCGS
jgi:pSer/pThr/pTyr-binding forkhead associated (FHA) protein